MAKVEAPAQGNPAEYTNTVPVGSGGGVKHIVSFSGGKDSTAMLLMMLEKDLQIDEIVFVDTTKDFPEMYEHINRVEKHINRQIIRLSFNFEHWFKDHVKIKGKNKGQMGYGWPDMRNRWCTALKRETIKRHMKGQLYINYVGIAVDEPKRLKNIPLNVVHPLVIWGMTEKDCLKYCIDRGFDWEGLYEIFNRVSCYCCPLQRIGELKIIHDKFPELWADIQYLDDFSKYPIKPWTTVEKLNRRFNAKNNNQN